MLLPIIFASVLTICIWLLYFPGALHARGPQFLLSGNPKYQPQPLPAWVQRLVQAQQNTLENLPSFIAVCLCAHIADVVTCNMLIAAYAFCIARVIYVLCYALAVPYIRSLSFIVSWVATLFIGYSVAMTL